MSSALHRGARRRPATAGLLAAAASITMLAVAPSAQAADGMEVALQDDAVFLQQQYGNRGKALDLASGLEVSRLRINVIWSAVNGPQRTRKSVPSNPTYNFTKIDDLVKQANARGLRLNLTIAGKAPAWASGDKKLNAKGTFKPNARLYGKFVGTVVKRYKGKVDAYSIWNEPNHKGWIQPVAQSPRIYRALYTYGYKAAKRADPNAKVWFGELAPYASVKGVALEPLIFLRKAFCLDSRNRPNGRRCAKLRADAFAYHPYDFARSPTQRFKGVRGVSSKDCVTMANLGDLTKVLDALARYKRLVKVNGSGGLDVNLTEFGYFASKRSGGRAKVFPAETRASYLVKGFKIAQANPRVKSMLQFLLVQYPDAGTDDSGFNFDTSIVRLDDEPTGPYVKTPSYVKLASWAKSAVEKGDIKDGP